MTRVKSACVGLGVQIALISLLLVGCDQAPTAVEPAPDEIATEVSASPSQGPVSLQGRYIVLFQRDEPEPRGLALGLGNQLGFSPDLIFETVTKGFAAPLPAAAVEALQRNPRVRLVTPDLVVSLAGSGSQSNPPWGLDRIDQRNLDLDASYTWGFDGTDVHAYIFDTGIRTTHDEFQTRASFDIDYTGDELPYNGDCHGHGTHVAGTVGGMTYGVAKNVRLHAVRVLDCGGSGYYSWMVDGLDWVVENGTRPAVVNMSLSGPSQAWFDEIVNNTVAAGVVVVVAAGNDYGDACAKSPASAPDALTVGSTTSSDAKSSFSNAGTCVDLFAPGSSVLSALQTSDIAAGYKSGTSMASPHAAGVAALYLDADPTLSAYDVMDAIIAKATPNVLSNVGTGSPNLLLYSLTDDPPPPLTDKMVHIGALSVSVNFGNRNSNGTATVTVVDDLDAPVEGATVTGDWEVDGSVYNGGASGITEASGETAIGSGALKNVTSTNKVEFCVTSVTGSGLTYDPSADPLPICAPAGDTPPPDTPSDGFTLTASVKANKDVILTWTGSTATAFDVKLEGDVIAGGLTGTSYVDVPGKGTWTYQVCELGSATECTNEVTVTTKR